METKFKNILEQATAVFMRYGIKSVTMDDVARELGISKKTLYLHFEDKNDLIQKMFTRELDKDRCQFLEIAENVKNAIDELFEVNRVMRERMANIHPSIIFDLQKYHPEAWKAFSEYKYSFIFKCVKNNFERGIKEGHYSAQMNTDFISRLYVSKLDSMFDVNLFPANKYNIGDIHHELIIYHMRAIASPKGLKYLEKKLNK